MQMKYCMSQHIRVIASWLDEDGSKHGQVNVDIDLDHNRGAAKWWKGWMLKLWSV